MTPITPDSAGIRAGRNAGGLALVIGLALLLAAGAAGAWWWLGRPRGSNPQPPLPGGIADEEVRRAVDRAREGVLDNPDSAAAWGHLGMVYLTHLFDREAEVCFAEAARLDPASPKWPYARGLIALKRAPDKALSLLRQAVDAPGESFPEYRQAARLQLAEALLERHEVAEAERLFTAARRRAPDDARAALGLGLVAIAHGDDRAAVEFLTAARSSPNAHKAAMAQLAALARARSDVTAAAEYEKEAAALPQDQPWPDPVLDDALRLLVGHRRRERVAAALEQRHDYAAAAREYLEQVREHPTAQACANAAINFARLRDYEQALPLLRQALELDSDSAQAHYTLALVQFSRAEQERQRRPDSKQAAGWLREAVEHARRATILQPGHGQAYRIWGYSLKYLGDPAAAVAPLRKGVTCLPVDLELQLGLGECLLEVGRDREAETHLKNAWELAPNDPRPIRALERLREKKG
jgi:tetratricopeptide (TPR) repeat protein